MKKNLLTSLLFAFVATTLSAQSEFVVPENIKEAIIKATPAKLNVTPKKQRKVLLFSNVNGFNHTEGIAGCKVFAQALQKNVNNQIEFTISDDISNFEKDKLAKFDAVFMNNNTGNFFCQDHHIFNTLPQAEKDAQIKKHRELSENLKEYLENGGGLFGIHAAADGNYGWEPYAEMIGGLFVNHPWGGALAVTIIVEDEKSPIVKGIFPRNEFKIHDEIYQVQKGYDRNKQRVLMSVDVARSPIQGDPFNRNFMLVRDNKDVPAMWVKSYGKGRVAYGTFGHAYNPFMMPDVNEFYMRAIQFACGDLDVDTTPSGDDSVAAQNRRAIMNSLSDFKDLQYGQFAVPMQNSYFRIIQSVSHNKELSKEAEQVILAELKSNEGTDRYKMYIAQCLEVLGANYTAKELGEFINVKASDKDYAQVTNRLVSLMARSKDANAAETLKKLATHKEEYIRLSAVLALGNLRDAKNCKFLEDVLAKASKAQDANMLQSALGALAITPSKDAPAAIFKAYKATNDANLKNYAAISYSSSAFENDVVDVDSLKAILAEKFPLKSAKSTAAILLTKAGKFIDPQDDDVLMNVINFIGLNKDVKVPAEITFDKISDSLKPAFVNALARRGEAFDKIIALEPSDSKLALAITNAAMVMGEGKDFAKLSTFAPLYNEADTRAAAFLIASVRTKDKAQKLMQEIQKASDKPKDLLEAALAQTDTSSSIDFLIDLVKSGNEDVKISALKALSGAVVGSSEAFERIAAIFPTLEGKAKQQASVTMVAASRRDAGDRVVAATKKLFEKLTDKKDKTFVLRFASENSAQAGVDFLLEVYKSGMQAEALKEMTSWKNDSVLDTLVKMAQNASANEEKQAIQDTIIAVIVKLNAVNTPAADYILNNALREKDASYMKRLKALNLDPKSVVTLPSGFKAASSNNIGGLQEMFDGNRNSRWATNAPMQAGQFVHVELPEAKRMTGFVLELGISIHDGVDNPRVFAGSSMEDFDEVNYSYRLEGTKQIFTFSDVKEIKMLRIESTSDKQFYWSIYELIFLQEADQFKAMSDMGNGMTAGSNFAVGLLPKAFDGDMKTRWATERAAAPFMWFQVGLESFKEVKSVKLMLGVSAGDRILFPRIFAGETIDSMVPVNFEYKKLPEADQFIFEDGQKFKFIRFENMGKTEGTWWSIYELEID